MRTIIKEDLQSVVDKGNASNVDFFIDNDLLAVKEQLRPTSHNNSSIPFTPSDDFLEIDNKNKEEKKALTKNVMVNPRHYFNIRPVSDYDAKYLTTNNGSDKVIFVHDGSNFASNCSSAHRKSQEQKGSTMMTPYFFGSPSSEHILTKVVSPKRSTGGFSHLSNG